MALLTSLVFVAVSHPVTDIVGVKWETNFEAAMARATKLNKPLLVMQLLGRLDDEFC